MSQDAASTNQHLFIKPVDAAHLLEEWRTRQHRLHDDVLEARVALVYKSSDQSNTNVSAMNQSPTHFQTTSHLFFISLAGVVMSRSFSACWMASSKANGAVGSSRGGPDAAGAVVVVVLAVSVVAAAVTPNACAQDLNIVGAGLAGSCSCCFSSTSLSVESPASSTEPMVPSSSDSSPHQHSCLLQDPASQHTRRSPSARICCDSSSVKSPNAMATSAVGGCRPTAAAHAILLLPVLTTPENSAPSCSKIPNTPLLARCSHL